MYTLPGLLLPCGQHLVIIAEYMGVKGHMRACEVAGRPRKLIMTCAADMAIGTLLERSRGKRLNHEDR